MIEGVDYAFSSPSPTGLYTAGKRFAMRYVGPGSAPKHLTRSERDKIWAAGLNIVLLAEAGADSALAGFGAGKEHASQARDGAVALGAPMVPIYFAVDFDVTTHQWPTVAAYLKGAGSILGTSRVGIYGSYDAMRWAARDGVAAWYFQTYAWSEGRWFAGNHVEQYHNGVKLAGGTVDLCRACKSEYGQWSRSAAPTPPIPEDDDMLSPAQSNQLEDVWHILLALAGGSDTAPVHDRDGKISIAVVQEMRSQSLVLSAINAALSAAGGNPDTAPVLAAISGLHDQLSALAAENHDLRAKLAAALDPGEQTAPEPTQ